MAKDKALLYLKDPEPVEDDVFKVDGCRKEVAQFEYDGVTFHASYWKPTDTAATPIKCLIVLVHGYGEYLSFAYDEASAMMARDTGALVFGHDHVGHGRTSGDRVQVQSGLSDFVDPILVHVKYMKKRHPDLPLFILGHSLGGLISLHCLFRQQDLFDGFITFGPLVVLDPDLATPFKKFLSKTLHNVLPNFTLGKLEAELVTRDPDVVQKLKDDDLEWKGGFRARLSWHIIDGCDYAQNNLVNLTLPILVLQGEKDKLVLPQGAKMLVDNCSSEDKQYVEYPDAFHHLFIELDDVKLDVFDKIKSWINARLK